jgi:hypothetical protein
MKGEDNLKVVNLQVEPSEFIAVSFAPLHVWTCLFCRSLGRVLRIKSMCPKIGCTPEWQFVISSHFGVPYNTNPQREAPKIAKLVYNSNNYGLWYL